MGNKTKIKWCDSTWNCLRGCSRVSHGCERCYAETMASRFSGPGLVYEGLTKKGKWTGKIEFSEKHLMDPIRWKKPRRIFVNSMSDLFHENVPDEWIDRIFAVMALAPQHTFQILTKRSERMREYCLSRNGMGNEKICKAINNIPNAFGNRHSALSMPLPNVMLGVSVEDQQTADERIPLLLQTPAAKRFVSYEPALGPVDFSPWLGRSQTYHLSASVEGMLRNKSFNDLEEEGVPLSRARARHQLEQLRSKGVKVIKMGSCDNFDDQTGCMGHKKTALDWIIVGGESGPGARPFDIEWARSVVEQCKEAGVACFVKQIGENLLAFLQTEVHCIDSAGKVATGLNGQRI